MKILKASPRGFCAGVDRAIHIVDEALRLLPPPIYVNHEIVHNSHVIKSFTDRGVIFTEDIEQVPEKGVLIFNAHGVPPSLRDRAKEKQLKLIDATCPLVSKVHMEALRHDRQGHHIVLIGHEGHAEVIGILGHAPENISLVGTPEDVANLTVPADKEIAYITQTTLSLDDTKAIIEALQSRFPAIKGPAKSDICYATTNRQGAVKELAKECDLIIVVGSANSSNSNRLKEVANDYGTNSFLINKASELQDSWFSGCETVGITAGASTPEHIVNEVITALENKFDIQESRDLITVKESEKFRLPPIA